MGEQRCNPHFSLEYTWCLMALEAVYGRDEQVWRKCTDIGRIPIQASNPRQCPPGHRKFQPAFWPNGRVFPVEPLLEALRRLDHFALERGMNTNDNLRNEFQSLLGHPDLGSTPLGSWLDVSIAKPFCETPEQ